MFEGLYNSASGLIAQSQIHEIIANNIAKANVAGHKRQAAVCIPFEQAFNSFVQSNPHLAGQTGGVKVSDIYTIYDQGRLKNTANPLDLAIEGEGFFCIDVDGKELYTRNGRFSVDHEGYIVTPDGHYVTGEQGKIKVLTKDGVNPAVTRTITVNTDGTVNVIQGKQSEQVGKLKIVIPENPDQLEPLGSSMFNIKGSRPEQAEDYIVNQGYLEESNVNIIDEMVSMISNMRIYETNQKIMKNYSDAVARSISEIGRTQ